ncbi:MAG: glycosyltransferase [Leptolyngbyaceae cyanobacterium bins.349]|nr:glycosyltransferase [Leptolyngbyaceae cyanobacterium bins.349]
MNGKLLNRAEIDPISQDIQRPLWSVMIPTYNCANYLRETLASVLVQDQGPDLMQIEVIDDCSTKDDPKAVVEELGKGRVSFYQQPQNVGYIKNFDTCLQRSRGKLVHLLHGDDWVRNGFYQKMQNLFEIHPDIGAAFCRNIYADFDGHWQSLSPLEQHENGVLTDGFQKIFGGIHIQTVAMVVRRNVYEHLGGFDHRFVCCFEDREMWVRIAAYYSIGYETEPLAVYRTMSTSSLTKRTMRSGEYARDMHKGLEIIETDLLPYLAHPVNREIIKNARENIALFILRLANQMLELGDLQAAFNQIQYALRCKKSFNVMKGLSKIVLKTGKYQAKKLLT